MPEPEINTLRPETGPQLDRITILSNSADGAPPPAPPSGKPPKPPRRRRENAPPQFLQEEEIARLFRAIDSVRDRAIFRIAYHAGLRASEIGLLELRDYTARTDRVFVTRLKGSNSGEHHMVREEARALRAWLKERGEAQGAIFYSRRGVPISRQMLDVLMKRYGAKAGIPAKLRHFHVLKHSCATHLASRGLGAEQVQDWIGHARIQNTMKYLKVTNSRREQTARGLKDTWK